MSTANLELPYLTTNILDPSLPVNECLMILDALVPHAVVDKDLNTPPTTTDADAGKVWIVGPSPTGRWDALALPNDLAVWRGVNSEHYITPKEGWIFYVIDEDAEYLFDGSDWVLFSGGGGGAARDTVSALATSGSVGVDFDLGDYFTLALAGNVSTFTFSNLPGSGKGGSLMIRITQDSTPRTVGWPASFKWAGGTPSVVSTGSGAVDVLAITTFDNGTTWDATLAKAFA